MCYVTHERFVDLLDVYARRPVFFKKPGVPKVFGLDLWGYSAPDEPVFALCFYNDKPSYITELDEDQDTVLRCDFFHCRLEIGY